MTKISEIYWGSYQMYEGPYFKGKIPYKTPKSLQDYDKLLAVITATEGGHYDAINMYDRMILSSGLIQWGEAGIFAVSNMLGEVCNAGHPNMVLEPLSHVLNDCNAEFKKNPKGVWRFFLGGKEVTTVAQQQLLFLGCDGHKGSWTPEAKMRAKAWAAAVASIWENPDAQEIQRKYTSSRLLLFSMRESKEVLFNDNLPHEGWVGAIKAIYLSFAANLPKVANDMLASTVFVGPKWSESWCISLIKRLTFGPNIAIYPRRYDAIRPVVESIYGIQLPKNAKSLETWTPSLLEEKSTIVNEVNTTSNIENIVLTQIKETSVDEKTSTIVTSQLINDVQKRPNVFEVIMLILRQIFSFFRR